MEQDYRILWKYVRIKLYFYITKEELEIKKFQ